MSLKVVVVGCGGIGGVVAARLTRAGVSVTPVTGNNEIAESIAKNGYQVEETTKEKWQVAANQRPVVSLADSQETFDLCLLATKATTLPDALREVLPRLAPNASVVCLQNGIPEEHAAKIVGKERVLGGVVAFGATMKSPGVYECTTGGGIQIGRPFPESPTPTSIVALLNQALPTKETPNLTGVRWSKLAINAATSTLGALGGERLWTLLQKRFVRRLVLEIWTELVSVARAADVSLEKVGGTLDINRMALNQRERATKIGSASLTLKHSVLLAVGMKFRRMRSSMLVALERGRTPEIDFLNGEISRQGKRLGVPTPVNDRLIAAVHQLMNKQEKPSMKFLHSVFEELRSQQSSHTKLAA
jgi:2-dehydropantoate 2-reductase